MKRLALERASEGGGGKRGDGGEEGEEEQAIDRNRRDGVVGEWARRRGGHRPSEEDNASRYGQI